jgi:hypothetical protein
MWGVIGDYWQFKAGSGSRGGFPILLNYPCPADRSEEAGVASGHYFHQDLLVARRIFERKPTRHVDVGSRVDGFVAHVATFREIDVLDLRPIAKNVQNIVFHQFDLTKPDADWLSCSDSVSCLHTLEHIGLGRYGDPIMVDGHARGFQALQSMLKPRGTLYLSVPIGKQRIDFNAHRVFAIRTILDLAGHSLELTDFSYVDDLGDLHENVALSGDAAERSFGCWYGCGIFEFRNA